MGHRTRPHSVDPDVVCSERTRGRPVFRILHLRLIVWLRKNWGLEVIVPGNAEGVSLLPSEVWRRFVPTLQFFHTAVGVSSSWRSGLSRGSQCVPCGLAWQPPAAPSSAPGSVPVGHSARPVPFGCFAVTFLALTFFSARVHAPHACMRRAISRWPWKEPPGLGGGFHTPAPYFFLAAAVLAFAASGFAAFAFTALGFAGLPVALLWPPLKQR
ncbi:hypothetical protein AAY473_014862 [Plecturocebus cupreus]